MTRQVERQQKRLSSAVIGAVALARPGLACLRRLGNQPAAQRHTKLRSP